MTKTKQTCADLNEACSFISLPRVTACAAASGLIALLAWSYAAEGIIYLILSSELTAAEKLSGIQDYFAMWGAAAPLVYLLLVTMEVVIAPIPGAMLYAPGGPVFGGLLGGSITLAGNVLGAAIACQVTRSAIGSRRIAWLERKTTRSLVETLERHGVGVVFLLRVNPLTSSDLVSYAAGMTRMPLWKLLLGTFFGMAPLCYGQAYLAERLLDVFPGLFYVLIALCAVYLLALCGLLACRRQRTDHAQE